MLNARGGILAAAAAALTAVFYGRAWRFDLQCDDLLMIRPWSNAELFAVWHGTWEPGGAFVVFFRPLATWFYAGTFELFGWNAPAHMLLSLAMLAVVAWLLALFVARESDSLFAGALAIVLYLAHPNVPWSTGTWVTNDFHKLTAISALCALLLWQRLRPRTAAQWVLLLPFVLICFLVKEDGLMLIPALLSIQWARAALVGDVKRPTAAILLIAGAVAAALVLWRYLALRELGGFGIPPLSAIFQNLARGPLYAFTMHGSLSVLTSLEKLLALAAFIVVGAGIWLMPRERRFLPVAGLLLMFWYDLPLALISNVMRYYMLTIASVIVLVPIFVVPLNPMTPRSRSRLLIALPVLILTLRASASSSQAGELTRFAPCQQLEHECVSWVLEEVRTLPPEARTYVADTSRVCTASTDRRPRIGEGGTLTWGIGATSVDTDTGERSNTVSGDVISLIRSPAPTATVTVRHPQATAAQPVHVEITSDGNRLTRELATPKWTTIEVPLTNGVRTWLRGAHRVDVRLSVPGAEWRK